MEMFRNSFPLSLLFFLPICILISPIGPASAAHEFAVYRMQQYDLQGTPYGNKLIKPIHWTVHICWRLTWSLLWHNHLFGLLLRAFNLEVNQEKNTLSRPPPSKIWNPGSADPASWFQCVCLTVLSDDAELLNRSKSHVHTTCTNEKSILFFVTFCAKYSETYLT